MGSKVGVAAPGFNPGPPACESGVVAITLRGPPRFPIFFLKKAIFKKVLDSRGHTSRLMYKYLQSSEERVLSGRTDFPCRIFLLFSTFLKNFLKKIQVLTTT